MTTSTTQAAAGNRGGLAAVAALGSLCAPLDAILAAIDLRPGGDPAATAKVTAAAAGWLADNPPAPAEIEAWVEAAIWALGQLGRQVTP